MRFQGAIFDVDGVLVDSLHSRAWREALREPSIIDHLRHTYHPRNSVLVKSPSRHWHPIPVRPGARTEDGLAVYRFGTDLYYANAPRLADDVRALTGQGGPLRWVVLDSAAIGDADYTAGSVLIQVIEQLHQRHIRFVVTSMLSPVRRQLDRYGVGGPSGPDAYFETPGEALEAFHAAQARQRPARASDR